MIFGLIGLFWTFDRWTSEQASHFPRLTTFMEVVVDCLAVMGVPIVFILLAISAGTGEIAESFTQRLTVLAPAISDSEYKILKARWANMRGKADYDALVGAMDKRATELGVNLPPVR